MNFAKRLTVALIQKWFWKVHAKFGDWNRNLVRRERCQNELIRIFLFEFDKLMLIHIWSDNSNKIDDQTWINWKIFIFSNHSPNMFVYSFAHPLLFQSKNFFYNNTNYVQNEQRSSVQSALHRPSDCRMSSFSFQRVYHI